MNFRPPTNYINDNIKLGYSNISRNPGFTPTRNIHNESQLNSHNFGELEQILERERKKFKEVKQKMDAELDLERKTRIQFENKLIKLKDEFSKKDIVLSQHEFKINNLLNNNQDLSLENERLKNELGRLEELYGSRIYDLENQLSLETKNFEETTIQYNNEFEKFKKQGQQYIETLTFELERKIKNLEDRLKQSDNARKELSLENKKINEILINNKLAYEQQLRDAANRIREEELKKSQLLIKSYEQKIKGLEQSREIMNRKSQQLLRSLQDRDRQLQDFQNEKNEQIAKYSQEISDLQGRINHLTFLYDKAKQELTEKDAIINRHTSELNQEYAYLKQQLQAKKKQNDSLNASIRDLRQILKDNAAQNERKRAELVERCNYYEGESRKYKQQYTRICDTLKSKINETITHVSHKR